MKNLTIVMYHYVRPIKKSSYPFIKGLELDSFIEQLNYLEKNYRIIKMQDVVDYVKNRKEIADNACLLTFDDGYKDHYKYVYPELKKRGIQGAFFPPGMPILENNTLDVHKIHFILASQPDIKIIIEDIKKLINECRTNNKNELYNFEYYWKKYALKNILDNKEVVFVKKMLQHVLPENYRKRFCRILFERYVKEDEEDFSKNLYMSKKEIKEMIQSNMYVGAHGYNHIWLNTAPKELQLKEIEKSLKFLTEINAPTKDWVMNYPYGSYNSDTIDILKKKNCCIGLTCNSSVASLGKDNILELPRLDTNYFLKKIN